MEVAPVQAAEHRLPSVRLAQGTAEAVDQGQYAAGLPCTGDVPCQSPGTSGRTVAVERDARARYPPRASNNALASWRSAVSKPSVNQP